MNTSSATSLSSILLMALIFASSNANSQIRDAEAIVVDMHELNSFLLDDGCILSDGELMPAGCTMNEEEAIILRGITTDTIRLQYMEMNAGASSPDHNHPDEEVFYILTGMIRVTGGDNTYTLEPGDVFIVPGYVPHEFVALTDASFIEVGGPGPLLAWPMLERAGGSLGMKSDD